MTEEKSLLTRFRRWSERRRQLTNLRLISIMTASIMITISGTTLFARASQIDVQPFSKEPSSTPAFGVAGTGSNGICSEIQRSTEDPPMSADCERIVLNELNFDIDYLTEPRSADILVANGTLRAGELAYFRVLRLNERPSYGQCTSSAASKLFWISFKDLPGRSVCVRSDEGRTAILQTERVDIRHPRAEARLTIWDPS